MAFLSDLKLYLVVYSYSASMIMYNLMTGVRGNVSGHDLTAFPHNLTSESKKPPYQVAKAAHSFISQELCSGAK